jgi:molybdate transport system ATP-binding protein
VPVTVTGLGEASSHSVLVRLEAGSETLLARVTRRSARELGIARGDKLVAQIKAVSLRPPGA